MKHDQSLVGDRFDDLNIEGDELDLLEYQATEYYSTQIAPNIKLDKENVSETIYSFDKSKRKGSKVSTEPPHKNCKILSNPPNFKVQQLEARSDSLHIYQLINDINSVDSFINHIDMIKNHWDLLKDAVCQLHPAMIPDILQVLGRILKRGIDINSSFFENLLTYIEVRIQDCTNVSDLEFISTLIFEVSERSLESIFKPSRCLISKFCTFYKLLDPDVEKGCDIFLPIVLVIGNSVSLQQSLDCDCVHDYFDVLFGLVQSIIISIPAIVIKEVGSIEKGIYILYECIKQIFSFSKTIVGCEKKSRLNIRYQYLLLAGAPLVYKYRPMTNIEIMEMDELMEHEPGYEIKQ
ncbi:hypothetical protein RF11_15242 [Thelohanellus kitauei]|uniref:Uncharacterized protein n=1 Tax=Thelohanellus kitauei TaxID=669202 RepID=A0A0C2MI52_THEKT|nr:hypothetical protein RF11_15242 [Thelohanellus kitauei]